MTNMEIEKVLRVCDGCEAILSSKHRQLARGTLEVSASACRIGEYRFAVDFVREITIRDDGIVRIKVKG